MSLLVGSVYADHPRSQAWYNLQLRYLNQTTTNYHHLIYLNNNCNFCYKSEVLKTNNDPIVRAEHVGQRGHVRGLNALIDHFNKHDEFDNLLLLDSDCFPIKAKWESDLLTAMGSYEIAAVTRYENLDTFAHPCAFYVKRPRAFDLKFAVTPLKNIVGYEFKDTAANIKEFFPLIRTNYLNHHPILFGVYWNRFYHHGAGSRTLLFRLFSSYLNEYNISSLEASLFEELVADPDKFLYKLTSPAYTRKIY